VKIPSQVLGTVVALLLSACAVDQSPVGPGTPTGENAPQQSFSAGDVHLFVLTEERGPSAELVRTINLAGGQLARQHDEIGVLTVVGLSDEDARSIAARQDVDDVGRDMMLEWIPPTDLTGFQVVTLPENHTDQNAAVLIDLQWYLDVINAKKAWNVGRQGRGALVCVLDTGVDPGHLDLAGRVDLDKAVSFVPSEPFIEDFAFHGTFVSSLIATNGIGMASVAPHARICPVKVLESIGENAGSGSFDWLIAGIVFSARKRADVINMSLGAIVNRREARALIWALRRAIHYANRHGTLVVAAAGNSAVNFDDFPDFIHVPSGLRDVISVSATAPLAQMNFDALASYSNFGKRAVDVAAPGGDFLPDQGGVLGDLILGACSSFITECASGASYLLGGGTSFASPLVAATGAVIESNAHRHRDADHLEACIIAGADQIDGKRFSPFYGHGRIDVFDSVTKRFCGSKTPHGYKDW
jgi:subtilisin family serine protease